MLEKFLHPDTKAAGVLLLKDGLKDPQVIAKHCAYMRHITEVALGVEKWRFQQLTPLKIVQDKFVRSVR